MNWWARFLLWITGVPSAPVADALPKLKKLVALSRRADPTMQKGFALYKEALPLINEAMPLIQGLWADWQEIAPAFESIIGSVNRQMAAGISRVDAFNNLASVMRTETDRAIKLTEGGKE